MRSPGFLFAMYMAFLLGWSIGVQAEPAPEEAVPEMDGLDRVSDPEGTDGVDETDDVADTAGGEDTETGEDVAEAPDLSPGQEHVAQRLAEMFDVDVSQVQALREQGLGYGEIHHVLALADHMPGGVTAENVHTIMTMRQEQKMGWGNIAKELDTTMGAAGRRGRHHAAPEEPDVLPGDGETPEDGTEPPRDTTTGTPGLTSEAVAPAESLTRTGRGQTSHRAAKSSSLSVNQGQSSSLTRRGTSQHEGARSRGADRHPLQSLHGMQHGTGVAGHHGHGGGHSGMSSQGSVMHGGGLGPTSVGGGGGMGHGHGHGDKNPHGHGTH